MIYFKNLLVFQILSNSLKDMTPTSEQTITQFILLWVLQIPLYLTGYLKHHLKKELTRLSWIFLLKWLELLWQWVNLMLCIEIWSQRTSWWLVIRSNLRISDCQNNFFNLNSKFKVGLELSYIGLQKLKLATITRRWMFILLQ